MWNQTTTITDRLQSAYKAYYSTETALIRVHHDITTALDNNCYTVLLMLDLSAAFAVNDHDILFKRLEFAYSDSALGWIRSYLSNRTQCVAVGNVLSDDKTLQFGLPQGSYWGLNFTACLPNRWARFVGFTTCRIMDIQTILRCVDEL